MDFQKAFDSVSHDFLPKRLQSYVTTWTAGVNTLLLERAIPASLKLPAGSHSWGSVLGPIPLRLYPNNLPDSTSATEDAAIDMYADDTLTLS